jgi:hypothetical protein
MKHKLKVGELVFLKNVGYPYNRTDDGGESWEGASCIVTELNSGYDKDMVTVEPLIPIKIRPRETMTSCLFHSESVVKENRPWLKKNLTTLFKYKKELLKLAEIITQTI